MSESTFRRWIRDGAPGYYPTGTKDRQTVQFRIHKYRSYAERHGLRLFGIIPPEQKLYVLVAEPLPEDWDQ